MYTTITDSINLLTKNSDSMNKKHYETPRVKTMALEAEQILAGSGFTTTKPDYYENVENWDE